MAEMYKKARGYGAKEKMKYGNPSKMEVMGHASKVYPVNTDSEKSDLGRMKYYSSGNRGYPPQAIQGDY